MMRALRYILLVASLAAAGLRDAPDFVEVGEAGASVDHTMRRQLAVQFPLRRAALQRQHQVQL